MEQRRAVLDALARSFAPGATVGEIVDAAAGLGWSEIGEVSLAELADALLVDGAPTASEPTQTRPNEQVDDDEDDAPEDEPAAEEVEEVAPARGRRTAASPKARPAAPKAAAKPAAKPAPAVKTTPTPAAKPKGGKPAKVSLDDRMSLDEAAAVLLPLVRALGEATMQQLEQSTAGAGRRKLRFHIGQLVKNGRLERHGMGRGTYYTLT